MAGLQPIVRSITGKAVIPDGTIQAGLITGLTPASPSYDFLVTGDVNTNFLSLNSWNQHMWLWVPAKYFLTRITAIISAKGLQVADDPSSLNNDTWYFVNSNLIAYGLYAAGSYDYNGTTIPAGTPAIDQRLEYYNKGNRTLPAAKVDATDTTLIVTENN